MRVLRDGIAIIDEVSDVSGRTRRTWDAMTERLMPDQNASFFRRVRKRMADVTPQCGTRANARRFVLRELQIDEPRNYGVLMRQRSMFGVKDANEPLSPTQLFGPIRPSGPVIDANQPGALDRSHDAVQQLAGAMGSLSASIVDHLDLSAVRRDALRAGADLAAFGSSALRIQARSVAAQHALQPTIQNIVRHVERTIVDRTLEVGIDRLVEGMLPPWRGSYLRELADGEIGRHHGIDWAKSRNDPRRKSRQPHGRYRGPR